ncbi:MAG: hypothetical protein XXXJIFNMEKO3_01171 [Candidatus Erwinia impunctatus]|nr:hypothetical protein XXXJIFNMEKO_01171 [Culicoides impunctatus]
MISVQILRAVAVLMVVLFHVLIKAKLLGLTSISFSLGAAGVDLFFVISGFIMVYITYNKPYSRISFLKKRVFRIIPLYWILTSIAAIVFILQSSLVNSHNGETTVWGSYTLLPVNGKAMLLAVAWTLQYEFLFYIIFSAFLSFDKKRYFLTSAAMLSIASLSFFKHDNYAISFISNPIIIEFVYGMLAFFILKHNKPNTILCLTAGAILLYFFDKIGLDLDDRYIGYGIPMLLFFLGVASMESKSIIMRSRLSKSLSYIGDASYSIYLTHTLSISFTTLILNKFSSILNSYVFAISATSLSLLAGIVCYELIEKRVRFKKHTPYANQQG